MGHRSVIKYLLLLTALVITRVVNAQMIYDTLLLGELEIFADKADYTTTTKRQSIDSAVLTKMNNTDLGEVLAAYTPIFIRSYGKGSLATASFRGTGANHTQILWNDFKINSPMLGQSDLSLLPTSFFDKVELYYGGASLMKSDGGLGGSVNVSAAGYDSEKPGIKFSQSYGSFNTWSTDLGLKLGSKKLSSDTRFIFQSSKNNFQYYNDAVLPSRKMVQKNAAFLNSGFSQQFVYKPAHGQKIMLGSWTQWNHQDIPPLMAKAEASERVKEYADNFFSRNYLAWSYQMKRSLIEVKGAYFYDNYQYHQTLVSSESNEPGDTLIDSKNKVNRFSGKVNYKITFKKAYQFSTGLDIHHDKVITNNYAEDKFRNTIGLYGNLNKNFKNRLTLNLLIRSQITDGKLLPLMPLLGVNVKILKNQNLYFRSSISRNYHLPTLNDLYWYPNGNKDLQPEQGTELEGGFNYVCSPGGQLVLKTDVTGYASKINNWIQWVDTENGLWEPQNLGRVFTRGIEISTLLDGETGKFNYHLFIQYTYTRTTQESLQPNDKVDQAYQLIYIPVHAANGSISGSFKGFYADWHLHFTGTQNIIGSELPAYLLNDFSFGKGWQMGKSGLEVRAKVYNIFNVSYQAVAGRAMPGRNYQLTIKYNFN